MIGEAEFNRRYKGSTLNITIIAYQHLLEVISFGYRSDFNNTKSVLISRSLMHKVTFFFARAQDKSSPRRSLSYTYTESSMTKHDDGFTPSLFAASKNLEECRTPDQ